MRSPPVEPYTSAKFAPEEIENCRAPYARGCASGLDALLADDVLAGDQFDPRDGNLDVPTGLGLGVELDAGRVAEYAELFEKEGATYSFTDSPAVHH